MLAPWLRPRASRFGWIIERVNAQGVRHERACADARFEGSQSESSPAPAERGLPGGSGGPGLCPGAGGCRSGPIGLRHFRRAAASGGLVLLKGMVAEMETGEGKTLVATLPACTAALAGVPVHIITVNDYLAERDAEWMGPIYRALGLTVGTIVHGMDPRKPAGRPTGATSPIAPTRK